MILEQQLEDILDSSRYLLSDIKPSEWAEQNRVMTSDVTPFPGPFSYRQTPYLREIVDALSQNHPARIVAVKKGAQIGMALHTETPIMTTRGWKKMGDLKESDFVFDETGKKCKVLKAFDVMHGRECYKVTFTDGSEIICDGDHLWAVDDLKKVRRVLTTKQILPRFKKIRKSGKERNRYSIPTTKPLQFKAKKLPIDPYLLGLWLGDGSTNANVITAELKDAIEYKEILKSKGIEVKIRPYKGAPHLARINVQNAFNTWKGGHNFYGNKQIPKQYKKASIKQRLELLQGLIDTDGHITKHGNGEFYNCNKKLIEDVKELIESLGYKTTLRVRPLKGRLIAPLNKYKTNDDLYVLNFMGTKDLPIAKLSRKKNRLKKCKDIRQEIKHRWISDIQPCESVPVRCITVDNASHLYLAGKSFIPTHNSTGVLESGMGWIISQNPGNILFLTGHIDLSEEAMNGKIDQMIDSCGLRPLIRPNIIRKKNQRTGDTSKSKEFPGGSLIAGGAGNHKLLRQRSVRYGFIDDFDAAKKSSAQSGNTRTLIQQRFAAYYDKMKLYYISTPELKQTSNIEPVYLLGDQRKYFIPCPCCGEYINLEWTVDIEGTEGREKGGITWKLDESGKLVAGSVGYICQKCSGYFDDSKKLEMNLAGEWRPTAEPSEIGYYSYHISSLYAPPGMYDWEYYVRQYLEACPPNDRIREDLYKTFMNLCLGEPYEQVSMENEANVLQRNIRDYQIGIVPEALSLKDGNGRIVMLTCACDLNGIVDDARLDYEIVAWAESGANYSMLHGSIGTFVPRENSLKVKTDREKWSYEAYHQRSVWTKLEEIVNAVYVTDTATPRKMRIAITGVDTGHYTTYAYHFLDTTNGDGVIGLKGDKESKFRKFDADTLSFKQGKERPDLFLLDVNYLKDNLAQYMQLKWHPGKDPKQPIGFMNYPTPSEGLYGFTNFFEHYQAEHRVPETKDGEVTGFRWVKKDSSVQNHMWDVRCYNNALKDIIVENVMKELKMKGTWMDFCKILLPK